MSRRIALVVLMASLSLPGCAAISSNELRCGEGDAGILAAQAVPSATWIPCIAEFPVGWSYGGFSARSGAVRFWMDSDRAGVHAIRVDLVRTCDTRGAVEADSAWVGPPGVRRFERSISLEPRLTGETLYTFTGGCATLAYDLPGTEAAGLLVEAEQAIELFPRSRIVTMLEDVGGHLCGAEAPPCVGGQAP